MDKGLVLAVFACTMACAMGIMRRVAEASLALGLGLDVARGVCRDQLSSSPCGSKRSSSSDCNMQFRTFDYFEYSD